MSCKIDMDTFAYPQIYFAVGPNGGNTKDLSAYNAALQGIHQMLEKSCRGLWTANKAIQERIAELESTVSNLAYGDRGANVTGDSARVFPALSSSQPNEQVSCSQVPPQQKTPRKKRTR